MTQYKYNVMIKLFAQHSQMSNLYVLPLYLYCPGLSEREPTISYQNPPVLVAQQPPGPPILRTNTSVFKSTY